MELSMDPEDLRPLVKQVVLETVEQLQREQQQLGRLGYVEPEAAAQVGVKPHVLRDCRLRGEISARLVGRRYVYSRESLIAFLRGKGGAS
jgi:hypothetical protein